MNKNRREIIKELSEEFGSYTENKIEKIVRNRKFVPNTNFVEKTLTDNRIVFDKEKVSNDNFLLLSYYQMLVQTFFSIQHPDRNTIISEMLNIFPHLLEYNTVVIYKFDLKNFYRSIDIKKILGEIRINKQLYPEEVSFLERTFSKIKQLSPGLGIINNLTEILGHKFDKEIQYMFGLEAIFYSRYVDDCVLVFDKPLGENFIFEKVSKLVKETFGENVTINFDKTDYLNLTDSSHFDYLGYVFKYKKNNETLNFQFGISDKKVKKEKKKIDKIVKSYIKNRNEPLLLTRLDLYYKRFVFLNQEKENRYIWEVRGISQIYSEARKLIQFKNNEFQSKALTNETLQFFQGKFIYGLFANYGVTPPKKMVNYIKNKKLISNLYQNRAVILHKNIGYSYYKLSKILSDCEVTINSSMSYRTLSKKFKNHIYNL